MNQAILHAILAASLFLATVAAPQAVHGASTENRAIPTTSVQLVEDHSQFIPISVRSGIRKATVLHVDAHDDLWPPPTDDRTNTARELLDSGKTDALEKAGRFFTPWNEQLYGINNYLVLAHRLGIASSVYWAVPSFGSMDNGALAEFKRTLSRARKFDPGEVDRLRIEPPYLKGTLSGVPLTIGALRDFPVPGTPWVLDIDLNFFPVLYKNPVSSSYAGTLAGFVELLRNRPPPPPALTAVAFSNNGDYLPISLRYLGRWLRDLIGNPALLEGPPPKTWAMKEEAVHLQYFDQTGDAISVYREIVRETPDDPDAHYNIGMLLLGDGDVDGAVGSLARAFRLDPGYLDGFVKASVFLERTGRWDDSRKVLDAAASLSPGHVLLHDAYGNHFHNRSDYPAAILHYRKVIEQGRPSPLTHAYLGDSHLLSGNPVEAEKEFLAAIRLHREHPDTELPSRYWLSLGEVRESLKKPAEARATYLELLGRPSLDAETERIVKERLERPPPSPTSP